MLAKYLSIKLDLQELGFCKRVTESAAQYAERLLHDKKLPDGQTAKTVAEHFVNYYKDHSFVIDIEEAKALLGETLIRDATPEYEFANEVYALFAWLDLLFGAIRHKQFACTGTLPSGILLRDPPSE